MNRPHHKSFADRPLVGKLTGVAAYHAAPVNLITADASTVSGADFFNSLFPDFAARREARRELDRQRCILAIERGNTYGFPPAMVEECRQIMADEQSGWALAERSAFGMGGGL